CALFGLALGLLIGTSSEPVAQLPAATPEQEDPDKARRRRHRGKLARARAAGNADWELLREVQQKDAPGLLSEFARKHPRDPRARHADRFGEFLKGERERRKRQQSAYLGAILEKAVRLESRTPEASIELYELVVSLAPRSEAAKKARSARRRLREKIIEDGGTPPDESPLPPDPNKKIPIIPKTGPSSERPPPVAARPSDLRLWYNVVAAYDKRDMPALEKAVAALVEGIPKGHYPAAAKGLLAFAKDDFVGARDHLAPLQTDKALRAAAGGVGMSRPQRALVRSAFFTKRYELARAVALGMDERRRDIWVLLIDGPFKDQYPLASAGLTKISSAGKYRVMADVGVTPGELKAQEKEMRRRGKTPARLAALQRKLRKSHRLLRTLGDVLDKASLAYNKLLKVTNPTVLCPTVYVFRDREGFADFGQAIGIGRTENALGYYMPSYRILVFYEQTEDVKLGLSRDTVETLLHEAFHQWLHLYVKERPAWLNEGMAEYFSIGAKISRKRLEYAVVPERFPSRLSNIRDALRANDGARRPWSFRRLLRSDHRTFMTHAGVNYAHSWSLIHYLGSNARGRKLLVTYFRALKSGASRIEAFDQVFGDLDLTAIEASWKSYVLNLK
ncbi:MAG: DUF1570 domain-containing protein, partial [Planctomycetes bacterium]|nr:DUF1570 domain-containing protein [Planctomycetota bacterium]